ncbi:protein of unassigned function [Methylobacterium oryzae CBMB20]|uniref:Protein of unassigned function n=1 Tax=Methylobacterium oryzae CBMB20 TaxID=693986 RepID=A0A089NNC4_9HYPH|nr:protein of unassigned function [Methylobacterium oryzae CBMB20]
MFSICRCSMADRSSTGARKSILSLSTPYSSEFGADDRYLSDHLRIMDPKRQPFLSGTLKKMKISEASSLQDRVSKNG